MENISKENLTTKYDGCNPVDFYDMTIDIPSLSSMTKNDESPYGWNVQFSEDGFQKYQNLKSERYLVFGIIGNRNSGKSYILSKITKYELPRGPNIKTKSISAIFPTDKWDIYFLDTAGLNNPIMNDKENTKSMKDNSQQKEIKKDKLLTHSFLISFLLQYSNILIVCVENLTFSEQQLLQRIRNSYTEYNIILVVHNLHHLTSKEEVEDYIDNVLKKSSTFKVRVQGMIKFEREEDEDEEGNKRVFVEISKEEEGYRRKGGIVHLIVGSEGTEAGNYYNQSTFYFIKMCMRSITKGKHFDIIKELMDYYSFKSYYYMEEGIGREEIEYDESLGKIYIDNHKQIILKEKFIKSNYEYEYEFLGDKKMQLKINLPGGKLNNKINYIDIDYENECSIIIMEVEKKLPDFMKIGNNNLSFSNIKHGKFKFRFNIPMQENSRLVPEDMKDNDMKWEEEEINGETKQTEILNITFSVEREEEEEEEDIEIDFL